MRNLLQQKRISLQHSRKAVFHFNKLRWPVAADWTTQLQPLEARVLTRPRPAGGCGESGPLRDAVSVLHGGGRGVPPPPEAALPPWTLALCLQKEQLCPVLAHGTGGRLPGSRGCRPRSWPLLRVGGGAGPSGRRGARELEQGLQSVGLSPQRRPRCSGPSWDGHYILGTHKGSLSPNLEDEKACPVP